MEEGWDWDGVESVTEQRNIRKKNQQDGNNYDFVLTMSWVMWENRVMNYRSPL